MNCQYIYIYKYSDESYMHNMIIYVCIYIYDIGEFDEFFQSDECGCYEAKKRWLSDSQNVMDCIG